MTAKDDGEIDRPDCPECDTEMYKQGDPAGAWWCDRCELEYWTEAGNWFCCGVHGRIKPV